METPNLLLLQIAAAGPPCPSVRRSGFERGGGTEGLSELEDTVQQTYIQNIPYLHVRICSASDSVAARFGRKTHTRCIHKTSQTNDKSEEFEHPSPPLPPHHTLRSSASHLFLLSFTLSSPSTTATSPAKPTKRPLLHLLDLALHGLALRLLLLGQPLGAVLADLRFEPLVPITPVSQTDTLRVFGGRGDAGRTASAPARGSDRSASCPPSSPPPRSVHPPTPSPRSWPACS